MSIKVFLSTVSDEFRAYRDQLRADLTRHNVEVKVQEDFKDLGGDTLDKLDVYITHCDAVVHLIGDMSGSEPEEREWRALLAKYPDLADQLPPLGEALKHGVGVSYTQWEAWLALYHGKLLLTAKAEETAIRGPKYAPTADSRAAQVQHLGRLEAVRRYPGCAFASPADLAKHIAYTAILDLLVKDYAEAEARAREVAEGFVREMAKRVAGDRNLDFDGMKQAVRNAIEIYEKEIAGGQIQTDIASIVDEALARARALVEIKDDTTAIKSGVDAIAGTTSRTETKLDQLPKSVAENVVANLKSVAENVVASLINQFRSSEQKTIIPPVPEHLVTRNVGLVVNARGKLCLVYDAKFSHLAEYIGYNIDGRQIEIFFDDGPSYPLQWRVPKEWHKSFTKNKSLLLIRMEGQRPVEGYETPIRKTRGPYIEIGGSSVTPADISAQSSASARESSSASGTLPQEWAAAFNIGSQDKSDDDIVLPTKLPQQLSEADLLDQKFVVVRKNSATYATLPIAQASQEQIEIFKASMIHSRIKNMDQFDINQLRRVHVRSFNNDLLFLPVRNGDIEVPFFLADTQPIIAERTNTWIYDVMANIKFTEDIEILRQHVYVFFFTVAGDLGAFRPVDTLDDVVWLPEASEEIQTKFKQGLQPFKFVVSNRRGVEFRGTVIYKDALFLTSVIVTRKWQMSLAKEEVIMESLPIEFGKPSDLLVCR